MPYEAGTMYRSRMSKLKQVNWLIKTIQDINSQIQVARYHIQIARTRVQAWTETKNLKSSTQSNHISIHKWFVCKCKQVVWHAWHGALVPLESLFKICMCITFSVSRSLSSSPFLCFCFSHHFVCVCVCFFTFIFVSSIYFSTSQSRITRIAGIAGTLLEHCWNSNISPLINLAGFNWI